MSENAWTGDDDLRTRASTPGLSLKDYVDREFAAMAAAGMPTMAEWLDDVGRHPITGRSTDDTVASIRELREADDPRDLE